jgi:hypothetical protein
MAITQNNKKNVGALKGKVGGYAFFIPSGVAIPTDFTTALPAGAMNLGYVSEDGMTDSPEFETEDHKDGNGQVVDTSQTGYAKTITATFIEHKADVLKVQYGSDNVTDEKGVLTVKNKGEFGESGALVIEGVIKGTRALRKVYPSVTVTSLGESTMITGDLYGTETTFTAYPDSDGVYDYEYAASTETEA